MIQCYKENVTISLHFLDSQFFIWVQKCLVKATIYGVLGDLGGSDSEINCTKWKHKSEQS